MPVVVALNVALAFGPPFSGHFGAWLSDVLFGLFGRPAYLFPIMLGVTCFVMFRHRDEEEGSTRYNTAVRIERAS